MKVLLVLVALGASLYLEAQATTDGIHNLVNLWYFYGKTLNNNVSISLHAANSLVTQPRFDLNKTTVFLIHGWNDAVDAPIARITCQAYLDNGNFNMVFVDWGILSNSSYTKAVANSIAVAEHMASIVLGLRAVGIRPDKLHFVGHSLGGQMAGMIGAILQALDNTAIINRITGLDPAGPLFYKFLGIPIVVRQLQPTDASFVDCIHTDSGFFGEPNSCGFIDFWPNGGTRPQPGCPLLTRSIPNEYIRCSHDRSWQFWSASLLHQKFADSFLAVQVNSYKDFETRDVIQPVTYNQMGINCLRNISGNFYLQSSGVPNFDRGVAGTIYQADLLD